MIKLTLTYINRTERTSARTNKPFTSLSIKASEYGDKFLSGFGNKANENWKVGDEVEVAEVKEVEKDGKKYLNFEMPKFGGANSPEVMKALEEIRNTLTKHGIQLQRLIDGLTDVHKATVHKADEYPERTGPMPFEDEPNIGDERAEPEN